MAKSKYQLFGGFYCVELKAVWNVVLTEWNTAGDGEIEQPNISSLIKYS